MPVDIDIIVRHYIMAGLWATTDEACVPLDANYGEDDISPEALTAIRADVAGFVEGCEAERPGIFDVMTYEQIGHDFLLTRDGHGAGFWDRGLGEAGNFLSDMARPFGDSNFYVGDNGQIHV